MPRQRYYSHFISDVIFVVVGTLNVVDVARTAGINVAVFGSGCIYEYDEKHPLGSGIGFKEEEEPNFRGRLINLSFSAHLTSVAFMFAHVFFWKSFFKKRTIMCYICVCDFQYLTICIRDLCYPNSLVMSAL